MATVATDVQLTDTKSVDVKLVDIPPAAEVESLTIKYMDEQKVLTDELQKRVDDLAKELETMYGSTPDISGAHTTMIIIQGMLIAKTWSGIKGSVKKQLVLSAFYKFVDNNKNFKPEDKITLRLFVREFGSSAVDGLFWVASQGMMFKDKACGGCGGCICM